MLIINRYLRREILQVFFFLLASFFFLYVLIDYSVHLKMFNQSNLSFFKILQYYVWQFCHHLTVLLPLSLMVATIKVLISMNVHGELSALFSAGVPFKRLYRPFMHIAFIIIGMSYINIQFLQPTSGLFLNTFEQKHFKDTQSSLTPIHTLPLSDNLLLLYQNYDDITKTFSNVFLITNFNELYRIKTLTLQKGGAMGKGVDVIIRNHAQKLVKKETRPSCFFSKVLIDEKKLLEKSILPKMQSLTDLASKLSWKSFSFRAKVTDKEAETTTSFSYKLLAALLPLLAVLAPPCFCLRASRSFPLFFIYAGFLFGFFFLFALLSACQILCAHQILPPFWGLFFIMVPLFTFFGMRYSGLSFK